MNEIIITERTEGEENTFDLLNSQRELDTLIKKQLTKIEEEAKSTTESPGNNQRKKQKKKRQEPEDKENIRIRETEKPITQEQNQFLIKEMCEERAHTFKEVFPELHDIISKYKNNINSNCQITNPRKLFINMNNREKEKRGGRNRPSTSNNSIHNIRNTLSNERTRKNSKVINTSLVVKKLIF